MSEPAFDRFTLVLLRRPAGAPDLPEEELDALQDRHLAHQRAMQTWLVPSGELRLTRV